MERKRAKRDGEDVDWISNLPDSLKFEILLKLRTKDVVKTSVLSTIWRNLWRFVPGLELGYNYFRGDHDSFVIFVDSFLGFNNESRLQNFSLRYKDHNLTKWINIVAERKVQQLSLVDVYLGAKKKVELPQTLYTCESLVSLLLYSLNLATSPKFVVSLPCLKAMDLYLVRFAGDLDLETLISGCPVLEKLVIFTPSGDDNEVLRVRSQSLLSFTYGDCSWKHLGKDSVLVMDAPRLEYLKLVSHRIASFELNNRASLVKAYIDTVFNLSFGNNVDRPKRNVIRNFLCGISSVKDMIITSTTLEVLYDYSRSERLPLFRNLSSLRVKFDDYEWEMLPVFLQSCPNLKSLVVGSTKYPKKHGIRIISGRWCLLKSLERPLKGEAMEMKLVSYLLEKSKILKKLTLDDSIKKDESIILKQLLTIPRISTCRVVVL